MNKEQAQQCIDSGSAYPLKNNGPLSQMPQEFRKIFHESISEILREIPQSDKDWSYQIKDNERGINYQLLRFNNPSENSNYIGFMVITRLGVYDVEKKEMLPEANDKIMVFKFEKVEDLLICPTTQS